MSAMDEEQRPTAVRVYSWGWGPEAEQRPGIPWLGLFLVVFGALLLIERLLPGFESAGSLFFLAVGLAFLLRWALDRRSLGSLYAGAIITALAAPNVIEAFTPIGGPGLGQLCLGVAFLAIAAVRSAGGAGIGWQAWVGVILTVLGASQLAVPRLSELVLPVLIVAAGAALVIRALRQ
jgi:hypothetical protein